jgi:hypothetical protein
MFQALAGSCAGHDCTEGNICKGKTSKYQAKYKRLRLGRLTPLSTIFQLFRGRQFYWWRKPAYRGKCINLKVKHLMVGLSVHLSVSILSSTFYHFILICDMSVIFVGW